MKVRYTEKVIQSIDVEIDEHDLTGQQLEEAASDAAWSAVQEEGWDQVDVLESSYKLIEE